MYDSDSRSTSTDAKAFTRRSAGSAAIAALLMCAYGYGSLSAPDPDSLFTWCNLVFYYTLRVGGVALALVAVWCWIGHAAALAAHGLLSLPIGVSLMLTGVGMLVDGGSMIQSVIIALVGWSFFGTGLRDLRAYRYLSARTPSTRQDDRSTFEHVPTPDINRESTTEPPPEDTLASKLRARTTARESDVENQHRRSTPVAQDVEATALPPDAAVEEPAAESEPQAEPDGGFLADLARQGRPPGV